MIKILSMSKEKEINEIVEKHNAQVLGISEGKVMLRFSCNTDYKKLFEKTRAELQELQLNHINANRLYDEIEEIKNKNKQLKEELYKINEFKQLMEIDNKFKNKNDLLKEIKKLKCKLIRSEEQLKIERVGVDNYVKSWGDY